MSDLNSVNLMGRLTRDIEVRYTQSNTAHSIFSIAVDRSVKKNDQWENEVSFIDIEVWGNLAENIKKYSGKGKRIAVNGYLVQKKWQAKDGSNQSKICVVANTVNAIDRVQNDQNQQPAPQQQYQQQPQNQQMQPQQNQQAQYQPQQPYPYEDIDDIPF
jgi:single-strand DNA-binding protein